MKILRWTAALALIATSMPALAATPKEQTQSALKNAAIAEETYAVDNSEYTESVKALKKEGLQYNDKVNLWVSWATNVGYCLRARHDAMEKSFHYDYSEGAPLAGKCPATGVAKKRWREQMANVLMNAAVAQESYATTSGTYTQDKADLKTEGWKNPFQEVRMVIVIATDTYYCMEAMHYGLDTPTSYDSSVGSPNPGTSCPS